MLGVGRVLGPGWGGAGGGVRLRVHYLPTRESGGKVVCPLSNSEWETSVSSDSELSVKVRFGVGSLVLVVLVLLGSFTVGCLFIC